MHTYTPKTFNLPEVAGISQKQMDVHLKLYEGYVTHVNKLRAEIAELSKEGDVHAYAIECLRRRLGWEFNGMRMHEFYFPQFEGGPTPLSPDSKLGALLIEKYGSLEGFIAHLTQTCMTRGPGWAVLSYDKSGATVHVSWTTEHEMGTLVDTTVLFAADMWEHAFMVDYVPAEKKKHIEALLAATNWKVVEGRLS